LEYLEIKKWSMFPGVALDKYEKPLAKNGVSLEMLEGASPIKDGGRLQKYMFGTREDSLVTGANR
jgi:hypothetical protein